MSPQPDIDTADRRRQSRPAATPPRGFDFADPIALAVEIGPHRAGLTISVGIDPGITGALAVLVRRGPDVVGGGVWDLPTVPDPTASGRKSRKALDLGSLYCWLRPLVDRHHDRVAVRITLERFLAFSATRSKALHSTGPEQSSGPGEYHNSRQAGTNGEIRGVLACLGVEGLVLRTADPTPQQWRKKLGLVSSDKEWLRQQALRLHPQLAHRLTAKAHHNRAEAILLADYAALHGVPA